MSSLFSYSREKNEMGRRFGHLLVVDRKVREQGGRNLICWVCKCDCGRTRVVHGDQLRRKVRSCGCQDKGPDMTKVRGTVEATMIEPHVYRTPRKIDMGPVVAAALAAVEERRASSL